MTTTVTRSMVVAPALAALLALSCGRSLTLDDRPGNAGRGAGGSSSSISDGGDAAGRGGAIGAAGTGAGGAIGTGGKVAQPDASADRITNQDAGNGVIDVRPPDLVPDRIVTPDVGGCPVDCTKLPHVRADAAASCVNGVCNIYYGTCDPGFAHCSSTPNLGCEADLSMSPNCGGCGIFCYAGTSCQSVNGYNYCLNDCQAPAPDRCDYTCVDLQTDPSNCGTCGHSCYVFNTQVECQQGNCVTIGCADPTVADCTSDPGCETTLGTDSNCGGCNDPVCTLANTMFTCSDGLGCTASVCQLGFANCDTTSPDCETVVASTTPVSGGCLPQYAGTVGIAAQQFGTNTVTAVAPDGSFFLGGVYLGVVDFDPSPAGKDIRNANDVDGFISKFNADGSYAWTATLGGRGDPALQQLAVTPSGGVVATGVYQDTIDLDPSAAQDIHFTNDPSLTNPFVVELSADGTEVWGRTFDGSDFGSSGFTAGVAVDGVGAVYVAGSFSGTFDFDPGAGTDVHTSPSSNISNTFLVKLTSGGSRVWSRFLDDAGCSSTSQALTVATDGSAWVTGEVMATGDPCAFTPPMDFNPRSFILKVDAAGDPPTIWTLGTTLSQTTIALAPGRDGAVYVGGVGSGDVDMDPGPTVARRWLAPSYTISGFVLKLAADGTYQWSRVLDSSRIAAMVPAPDGGVLAIGVASSGFVSRLSATGASLWTIPIGNSQVTLTSGGAISTTFTVGGTSSGTQDFDPGPGIDLLFGDIAFASRFKF